MAKTFSISKSDIAGAFDRLPHPVLRLNQIGEVLQNNREVWRLAKSTSLSQFVEYLLAHSKMKRLHLALPHRAETLYLWGEVSPYAAASAAKPGGYLCHFTAMHLHDLTHQTPATIYANSEQRPQPRPAARPTQASIDAAFGRPQRLTTNICPLWDGRLCMINGKHTGRLGVEARQDANNVTLSVSGLERTLIDIAVRPVYAGGVSEVLEAYLRAKERVSLNRLAAMLKKMDFVYPYEQAIGFYLERSGVYERSRLDLFRTRPFEFDFYLTYAMPKTEYSSRWRLFFPAGM